EQKEAYINQIVKYLTSSTITKSNNYKTTASLWRAKNDSQNKMQTLLYITNEPLKYDAALSKTIVVIKKSGESQFESISNREKGAVEKDSNKSEGEDKQTKSDLAKISVSKGDQIKYRITVYNQGEQNIRITKIKDYLPDGLILASNQDNWSNGTTSDGKKYILTSALENTILYTEENKDTANNKNSQLSIEVICEVADTATGTLRNYAEIAEMKNEAGNSIISTDEDSTPDNYKDGTKNEDDTDFEEVEVQGEFDLALKKYVNQIIRNGQTISYSQSRNNSTRSTKNSNPVNIQVGDIVIFNINVKNQGLIDGTVTKITDYIPAGLAYLPDYSTSSTNLKWSLPSSVETKGITDYSDDVTKNLIASDFNKSLDQISIIEGGNLAITYNDEIPVTKAINGNETVSDAIQVACLVTSTENTIKNIAEISAQKETLEDIDSVPGNLKNDERTPKTVDETVDGFSYEDDEDFDVLEPRNLDIRKYVKQVKSGSIITDGRTVSTGTIQEVDTIDKTNPVPVKKGDIVTFGIRVYNEGNSD
ncbi:MAG: DUF11 domain-containing protein, partial [Clostridia bacterium]|nr:DUF11 domain-containing protein [Clostridia bacterium]